MTITIVGAGMAGLLAANMLQRHRPRIIESQPSLPNNHSAVLRFGSDKVAEVTGIPFKRVKMIKGTLPWKNPVADALSYAAKCSGFARSDRSIPVGIERGERWIAPQDLIARMAGDMDIQFNTSLDFTSEALSIHPPKPRVGTLYRGEDKVTDKAIPNAGPYISTIPMPALMDILQYPDKPDFKFVEGANLRFTIANCDAYVSLYVPDPAFRFNRVSVTGDEIIAEFAFPHPMPQLREHEVHNLEFPICDLLGIRTFSISDITYTHQRYAKIQPIDDIARKKFLAWATDNYNIFSLGRFATWRPGLLLDDLVHDVRQIEKWIGDRYAMKFAR